MRRTLGTAVFSGMLGVTIFGVFLTPVFFYVVRGLTGRRSPAPRHADLNGSPAPAVHHGPFHTPPEDGFGHIAAEAKR